MITPIVRLLVLHAAKQQADVVAAVHGGAHVADEDAAADKTLISLDVAVTHIRARHLLDPGRYKLTLKVAGQRGPEGLRGRDYAKWRLARL
jgi:hypothetical protein